MRALARFGKQVGFLTMVYVLLLLALPLIVFWPVTVGERIWIGGDFSTMHYPFFVLGSQQWQQGHVPLWNPYIFGGTPLLASQQASVLYPFNIILWLTLSPTLGMGYTVLLHLGMTGLSVFFLLRSLRLHPAAAFLGAITVTFGGFTMSHLGHLVVLRALPWIGFALCSYNRWTETRKLRYLAGISVSVGLLFLSGHPQTIVYAFIFVLTYFLFARRASIFAMVIGVLACGLGIGLSAVQLLPGVSMWFSHEFQTLTESGFDASTVMSFHPAYVMTLLFPQIRPGTYAEMVGYVGIVPLLLALAGLVFREEGDNGRTKVFFVAWAGIALILSLGRFVPLLSKSLSLIPIYGSVTRVPSRHLLEFSYSVAILAAFGLNGLLQHRPAQRPKWTGIALMALGLAGLVGLALTSSFSTDIPSLHWEPSSFRQVWQPLLLLVLAIVLLVGLRRINLSRPRRFLALALLTLTILDLVSFGVPIYVRGLTSPSFYATEPATVAALRDLSQESPVRILSFEAAGDNKELLAPNYSTVFGLESMIGYDSLILRPYYSSFAGAIPVWGYVDLKALEQPGFRALLDIFGVKYLLAAPGRSAALAPYYTPKSAFKGVDIYLNEHARPRLFPLVAPHVNAGRSQTFGRSVSLVNYSLQRDAAQPGYELLTRWFCKDPLPENHSLYVHYLDEAGNTITQDDHLLVAGLSADSVPTREWECPGYYWDESYVPPEAGRGDKIRVGVGLWVPETELRLIPSSTGVPVDQSGRARLEVEIPDKAESVSEAVFLDEMGKAWVDPGTSSADAPVVKQTFYQGDRIGAEVSFDQAGILVHATNYASGWKAAVDGIPSPVIRVAGLLQGVQVPEGQHRVEFWYEPDAFKLGAAISAVALVLVLLLAFWPQRARG